MSSCLKPNKIAKSENNDKRSYSKTKLLDPNDKNFSWEDTEDTEDFLLLKGGFAPLRDPLVFVFYS